MAKIELPEGWDGVAEPLRALMAEIEREAHADGAAPPDLAAVSARSEAGLYPVLCRPTIDKIA